MKVMGPSLPASGQWGLFFGLTPNATLGRSIDPDRVHHAKPDRLSGDKLKLNDP